MPEKKTHRPSYVEDKHIEYLDGLRESGAINMWGAGAYLAREFSIDENQAAEIFFYWKNSFAERNPQ